MPEILEVEAYRRLAERVVGRTISAVEAPDAWFVKGGATPEAVAVALVNRRITASRRHGKVLLLDSGGPTLGLRFGMTGRLLVDGEALVLSSEEGQDNQIALEPGACFGEMAILAEQPRSATVVAGPNGAQTLVLDGVVFREALIKQPTIGMELLKTFSKRLA